MACNKRGLLLGALYVSELTKPPGGPGYLKESEPENTQGRNSCMKLATTKTWEKSPQNALNGGSWPGTREGSLVILNAAGDDHGKEGEEKSIGRRNLQ